MVGICSIIGFAYMAWAMFKTAFFNLIMNLCPSFDSYLVFFSKTNIVIVVCKIFSSFGSSVVFTMIGSKFFSVLDQIFMAINTRLSFDTFPTTSAVMTKFCDWFIDETSFTNHGSNYTHAREVTQ